MTCVKICGLTNVEDALQALEAGADFLGFVLYPRSPRCVTADRLRILSQALPPMSRRVGVFVNESRAFVQKVAEECGLTAVQVHGDESPGEFEGMAVTVWRAIRLKDLAWSPDPSVWKVDRFVLDAASPAYGGSGLAVDWEAAKTFAAGHRAMLAGGLSPSTVAGAIRQVRPLGVDVASGVESVPGKKDHQKVAAFIRAVREADEHLAGRREDEKGMAI